MSSGCSKSCCNDLICTVIELPEAPHDSQPVVSKSVCTEKSTSVREDVAVVAKPLSKKANTLYRLPESLIVITCYLSATALGMHILQPWASPIVVFTLCSMVVLSYIYHSLYLSGLQSALHHLKQYTSFSNSLGFIPRAGLFILCFIENITKLGVLLVHIGFESAVSLHGAYQRSRNLLLTSLMALSHGMLELLAEYGSMFSERPLLILPTEGMRLRMSPRLVSFALFLCSVAPLGFFGFVYGSLYGALTDLSATVTVFGSVLVAGMAYIYSSLYTATIRSAIEDQSKHDFILSPKHLLVLMLSCVSGVALYFEYDASGMVLAESLGSFFNPIVGGLIMLFSARFGRTLGFSNNDYCIQYNAASSLMSVVARALVVLSSSAAAALWSWVMYRSATNQTGCIDASKEVTLPDYYAHIAALVGGLIAAVELHEFVSSFAVGKLPLLPLVCLSAVSAYLVEYAFFSSNDAGKQESLSLSLAKATSKPLGSLKLNKNTTTASAGLMQYVRRLASGLSPRG